MHTAVDVVPKHRSRTRFEPPTGRDWLLWRQGIDERLTGECPVLDAEEEIVENNPGTESRPPRSEEERFGRETAVSADV